MVEYILQLARICWNCLYLKQNSIRGKIILFFRKRHQTSQNLKYSDILITSNLNSGFWIFIYLQSFTYFWFKHIVLFWTSLKVCFHTMARRNFIFYSSILLFVNSTVQVIIQHENFLLLSLVYGFLLTQTLT